MNCLTAAHLLDHAGASASVSCTGILSDQEALAELLDVLADVSDQALRDEDVLDALHHVLLAHIAAR
ncbi:MAG: hypothetical protein ACRDWT_11425 [Jatrophihabitantaceae bacterium]